MIISLPSPQRPSDQVVRPRARTASIPDSSLHTLSEWSVPLRAHRHVPPPKPLPQSLQERRATRKAQEQPGAGRKVRRRRGAISKGGGAHDESDDDGEEKVLSQFVPESQTDLA